MLCCSASPPAAHLMWPLTPGTAPELLPAAPALYCLLLQYYTELGMPAQARMLIEQAEQQGVSSAAAGMLAPRLPPQPAELLVCAALLDYRHPCHATGSQPSAHVCMHARPGRSCSTQLWVIRSGQPNRTQNTCTCTAAHLAGWLAACRMGLGCMKATDASTSASFPCARCGGGAWHQQQTGSAWQAGWGWLGCCWLADLLTGPQVGPLSLFTPQWLAAFHTYPPRYVASPPAAASCADERRQALLQMRQLRGPVPCLRVPRLQRSRRGRAQTQHTGSF